MIRKTLVNEKVCGWHPVSVEGQVAVMFWDALCVSNMHFPKKDVIEGIKGPCKNKLQTQPSSFVSLSLSFADDVHPEGSPGSCWGWTLALDHSLVLKYLVLGIPFPPVMQESLLNFYLPGFKVSLHSICNLPTPCGTSWYRIWIEWNLGGGGDLKIVSEQL